MINKKFILNKTDIKIVDIELSNICNLKCPLCISQLKNFKFFIKKLPKKFIDINKLLIKLSEYPNIEEINIGGNLSEPTLHPELIKFIDYFYYKNIQINLFTNGTLHNINWWKKLSTHFNSNSKIIFTICGTTQAIHEKYRVGSKLNNILENALAFKNNNHNDVMQYIKFEYNKNEDNNKIFNILKQFSNYKIIDTDPIYERFNINKTLANNKICSDLLFSYKYRKLLKKIKETNIKNIQCYCYKNKFIRINNLCQVTPCICYYLFVNQSEFDKDNILDYTDILNGKFQSCIECDKQMLDFLTINNRDQFYMC